MSYVMGLESQVVGSCPVRPWELSLALLQEQQAFLTTEPSLHPLFIVCLFLVSSLNKNKALDVVRQWAEENKTFPVSHCKQPGSGAKTRAGKSVLTHGTCCSQMLFFA